MKKIFIVIIFLFVGCTKVNNKVLNIKGETILSTLKFETLSVLKLDDLYVISTKIFNKGNKEKIDTFNITVKNKDENTIVKLKGIIGNYIEKEDYVLVITNTYEDLDDIYSIEYSL